MGFKLPSFWSQICSTQRCRCICGNIWAGTSGGTTFFLIICELKDDHLHLSPAEASAPHLLHFQSSQFILTEDE
ncbi:hypothetical protein GN956_G23071 [Arapaima gigas]